MMLMIVVGIGAIDCIEELEGDVVLERHCRRW